YLAEKAKDGFSAGSRNRQLNVLSFVCKHAKRQKLIRDNPVPDVERPREARRKWRILTPTEVGEIERAFDDLITEAEADRDRDDLTVARRLFLFHMGASVRRAEAMGLRWRWVFLADPEGAFFQVEETFVRGVDDTPKSEAGHRTIALGKKLADELFEH